MRRAPRHCFTRLALVRRRPAHHASSAPIAGQFSPEVPSPTPPWSNVPLIGRCARTIGKARAACSGVMLIARVIWGAHLSGRNQGHSPMTNPWVAAWTLRCSSKRLRLGHASQHHHHLGEHRYRLEMELDGRSGDPAHRGQDRLRRQFLPDDERAMRLVETVGMSDQRRQPRCRQCAPDRADCGTRDAVGPKDDSTAHRPLKLATATGAALVWLGRCRPAWTPRPG